MKTQEILNVINKLNSEIYEQTKNDYIYLEYMTNGYIEIIEFLGYPIWNSEDDCREYIDEENYEREDLEIYLRREINNFINNIVNIKLY